MDDERRYDAGSEASSPTPSGSVISLAERKKPCEICGSDANEDKIMTCFRCQVTREHIYCARVMLKSVPSIWLCTECCSSSDRPFFLNPRINQVVANDQIATPSRTTHQVVDSVVGQNMSTSYSVNQLSATHQLSQEHASSEVEDGSVTKRRKVEEGSSSMPKDKGSSSMPKDEGSSSMPKDTSPVQLPNSNLPSDSESAI